jgi:hypothetical protein
MDLRKLLTKLNDTIRPLHVEGQEVDRGGALDAKVVARGIGNPGSVTGNRPAPAPTKD